MLPLLLGGIMNILLTGPTQIGKSTILKKVIQMLKLEMTGFYTQPFLINNKIIGYKMIDYQNALTSFIIGIKDTPITCKPYTLMFETKAYEILSQSVKDAYLLDELGFLERYASSYKNKILDILDSDKLVLGVLKDKKSPFLDTIRERNDVIIIRVTESNRDFIPFEILRLINVK